jgi:hypothetical protein
VFSCGGVLLGLLLAGCPQRLTLGDSATWTDAAGDDATWRDAGVEAGIDARIDGGTPRFDDAALDARDAAVTNADAGDAGVATVEDADLDAGSVTASDGGIVAELDAGLDARRDAAVDHDAGTRPTPVRLSETDRDPAVRLRFDDLAADLDLAEGGVRSDASIAPRSGVFYYESRRLTDQLGPCGTGVATSSYPLLHARVGASDQSFGISIDGGINYDDGYAGEFDPSGEHYGFVVDYRGRTPTVYLIASTSPSSVGIAATQAMPAVVTPLFILVAGQRRAVEFSIEINPGNDTTNFPFHYDPAAILRAAGHADVADALVLGWGRAYAGPVDAPPTLTLSSDQAVRAGTPVTVTATASDAEDGALTSSITWDLLSTPYYIGRTRGAGGSFSFTPTAVGVHPARATVVDSIGHITTSIVRVTVTGPVAQHDPVVLAPDALSGTGIVLSGDGLSARFTGYGKMGIRANQSCYGQFWYFEARRLIAPVNMGVGIVIGAGNLDPYGWSDVPASMSVNVVGGDWRDLVPERSFDALANDRYGFAVDYRGVHPRVYVIVGRAVFDQLYLDDVWTEIYPMVYGNPTTTTADSYDERINFGATPFTYDPVAALTAAGIDATGLEVGWGDANTTP